MEGRDARAARDDGGGDIAQAAVPLLDHLALRSSLDRLLGAPAQVAHRAAQLAQVEDRREDEDALEQDGEAEVCLRAGRTRSARESAVGRWGTAAPRRLHTAGEMSARAS